MYAVIRTGGKQYRVTEGQVIEVEKLDVNGQVTFEEVLLVANGNDVKIGTPVVAGAKVTAEVVEQFRGEKVRIVKFRRRKHHLKQTGHRQYLTKVKITGIAA
ncbi:50S ribosomal protein L21 [Psittacicella hinzii]|uniref:50S ribosomal protein L21 n=1 Tax=Psittacicella hinzii TaxID=2028575 RepID=UPI00361CE9DE